jgi:hypothetical protein
MFIRRNLRGTLSLLCLVLSLVAAACKPSSLPGKVSPESTVTLIVQTTPPTAAVQIIRPANLPPTPSQIIEPSATISPTPTNTSTLASTSTSTLTPTIPPTSTPTLTSTYAILRGTVLEQANCRYGPGAAYLYKYGLYPGNNIEIIGRNELGTWIVIQAIGGNNPCWVKASLMDIHGNVMSVAPASLPLPQSPYYGPVTGVWADRSGNSVIITWDPINLRAGDDSLQYPYLIEAWLCQKGQFSFLPIGAWETILTVQDEPGCAEQSHARIYGVEKHGYTNWVTVPWPVP